MNRKHLLFLLLVLFLTISFCPAATKAATLTASGSLNDIRKAPKGRGTLKITRKGKRFLKKNGTYAKNTWLKINGAYYYFNKRGYAHKGWLTYNGQKYYLSQNGARTTWTSLNGKWYYFKKNGVLSEYKKSDQILLIRGSGSRAKVYFLEKKSSTVWKLKRRTTGYLGRLGVGTHREGVPNTPSGDYSFGVAFGTESDPGTDFAYTQVDSSHYWVDDSSSAYYNQFVSTNEVTADWNSAEHLIDYPTAYAYALSLNYNTKGTAGKGSAIFLHCSTGGPTAGCISVPQKDMVYFLKNLKTDARIIIQKS